MDDINITIDSRQYESEGLTLLQWVILSLMYHEQHEFLIKALNEEQPDILNDFLTLETRGYVKLFDFLQYEKVGELRDKGKKLFINENLINFDEFFEAFPIATTDGRALRVASKFFGNNVTEGYKRAKKIYMQKVKSKSEHEFAVRVVKARALSGDTKFMQNIETYIRQKTWEVDNNKYNESPDWDRTLANQ